MNSNDTARAMEAIEKCAVFNYFEKLIDAPLDKITLFPVFPYTAAANLSDPKHFMMVEDLARIAALNCGNCNN